MSRDEHLILRWALRELLRQVGIQSNPAVGDDWIVEQLARLLWLESTYPAAERAVGRLATTPTAGPLAVVGECGDPGCGCDPSPTTPVGGLCQGDPHCWRSADLPGGTCHHHGPWAEADDQRVVQVRDA